MFTWETLTVEQAQEIARDMQREIDEHAKYCDDELQRADMRAEMRDGVAFTLAHLAGLDISYARHITGFHTAQDEYYALKEEQQQAARRVGRPGAPGINRERLTEGFYHVAKNDD